MFLALLIAAQTYGPQHLPPVIDAEDPLVDAAGLVPGLIVDLAYATADNIAGRALYPPDAKCLLRRSVAQRLAIAADALRKRGLRLVARDCTRPADSQRALWKAHPHAGAVADPSRGSLHARGVAVDLDLLDERPPSGSRPQHLLELRRRVQNLDSSLVRRRPDHAAAEASRCQVVVGGDQRGRHLVAADAGLQSSGDAQAAVAQIQGAAEPGLSVARMHFDEQLAGEAPVLAPWSVRVRLPARRGAGRGQIQPDAALDALTHPAVQKRPVGGLRHRDLDDHARPRSARQRLVGQEETGPEPQVALQSTKRLEPVAHRPALVEHR